mgnify:CR=1 FL=1
MYDNSRGGNDTLIGGANTDNELFGDAFTLHGNARGGDDTLTGGDSSTNNFYGDAFFMVDNARGGDDTLVSGANATNTLYGDAFEMHDNARGGNDTLTRRRQLRSTPSTATPPPWTDDSPRRQRHADRRRASISVDVPQHTSTATPSRCTTTPAAATTR